MKEYKIFEAEMKGQIVPPFITLIYGIWTM